MVELAGDTSIIFDYEIDFPSASATELALYSDSLVIAARSCGIGKGSLGAARRAGVVQIPIEEYVAFRRDFEAACSRSSSARVLAATVERMIARADGGIRCLERNADEREPPSADLAARVHGDVLNVMSFHVFNWMLPVQRFEEALSARSESDTNARRFILSQLVSAELGHMSLFYASILRASALTTTGRWTPRDSFALALELGHIQSRERDDHPLDDPHAIAPYLDGVTDTLGARVQSDFMLIRDRKAESLRLAEEELALITATSLAHPARLDLIDSISVSCRMATLAEEQRRMIQARYMRIVRRLGEGVFR